MPVFPALALVAGGRLRDLRRSQRSFAIASWGAVAAGLVVLAGTPWLPAWQKFDALGPDADPALVWLQVAAAAAIASGAGALAFLRFDRVRSALVALIVGSFAFWHLASAFLHEVDDNFSSERLIEELTNDTKPFEPNLPFYSVAMFDHSAPFYLGRTLTLVDARGELGPGIDAEPQRVLPTVQGFAEAWIATPGMAYAMMRPSTYADLGRSGLPMQVVIRDRRLVVVSRRPVTKEATPSPRRGAPLTDEEARSAIVGR